MLGFVAEQLHAQHAADAAKAGAGNEQCCFRHAPPVLFGAAFVIAHHDEGDQIGDNQENQCDFGNKGHNETSQ